MVAYYWLMDAGRRHRLLHWRQRTLILIPQEAAKEPECLCCSPNPQVPRGTWHSPNRHPSITVRTAAREPSDPVPVMAGRKRALLTPHTPGRQASSLKGVYQDHSCEKNPSRVPRTRIPHVPSKVCGNRRDPGRRGKSDSTAQHQSQDCKHYW